nr:DUF126 domain-containing protein [Pyrobaculum calidifontis]
MGASLRFVASVKPVVRASGVKRVVRAEVVKITQPVSLLGDFDPETGRLLGVDVVGKIVALPYVKGSTVGPYLMWSASRRGKIPLAVVAEKPDLMLVTACVLANVPLFQGVMEEGCVELDLESGEYVKC